MVIVVVVVYSSCIVSYTEFSNLLKLQIRPAYIYSKPQIDNGLCWYRRYRKTKLPVSPSSIGYQLITPLGNLFPSARYLSTQAPKENRVLNVDPISIVASTQTCKRGAIKFKNANLGEGPHPQSSDLNRNSNHRLLRFHVVLRAADSSPIVPWTFKFDVKKISMILHIDVLRELTF